MHFAMAKPDTGNWPGPNLTACARDILTVSGPDISRDLMRLRVFGKYIMQNSAEAICRMGLF